MATIAETAPQLGWGIWSLSRDEGGLSLTVRNSPFRSPESALDTPLTRMNWKISAWTLRWRTQPQWLFRLAEGPLTIH